MTAINKIITKGDEAIARQFFGFAQSQMDILINQMSFQNLSQGIREVQPYPGVIIRLTKVFDYQECRITVDVLTTADIIAIICGEESEVEDVPTLIKNVVFWDTGTNTYPVGVTKNNGDPITAPVSWSDVSNFFRDNNPISEVIFPGIYNVEINSAQGTFDFETYPIVRDPYGMEPEYGATPPAGSNWDPVTRARVPATRLLPADILVSENILLTFTTPTDYTITATSSTIRLWAGVVSADQYIIDKPSAITSDGMIYIAFIDGLGWGGTWQAGDTISFSVAAKSINNHLNDHDDWNIPPYDGTVYDLTTPTPDYLGDTPSVWGYSRTNTVVYDTHYPEYPAPEGWWDGAAATGNYTAAEAVEAEVQLEVLPYVYEYGVSRYTSAGGSKVICADDFGVSAVSFGFQRDYLRNTVNNSYLWGTVGLYTYDQVGATGHTEDDITIEFTANSPFLHGDSVTFTQTHTNEKDGEDGGVGGYEMVSSVEDDYRDALQKCNYNIFSGYTDKTIISSQQIEVTKQQVTTNTEYVFDPVWDYVVTETIEDEEGVIPKTTNIFLSTGAEVVIDENPLEAPRHTALEEIVNGVDGYIIDIQIYEG